MSIQSKLYVENEVFDILESNFHYNQKFDINNRPLPKVFGGIFNIVVPSGKSDTLTDWAIRKTMMKNVKIVQIPNFLGGSSKSRTFELLDTYCVFDKNQFESSNNEQMKNFITLSPAILKLDGQLLHERNWKVTDIKAESVIPTTIENEPNIIKYHLEDMEGVELFKNEIDVGEEIMMVVETINAIGETLEFDLDDQKLDYEHNGIKLKEDMLKVKITADIVRVPLKAILQEN
ncbi:hypothetical protein ULMS_18680 [Patiriisocius marinistellae]|uniref:Uncharacterized protein n=1 Tax=Patiriisocius marinistellae TaxID=2494560 RepID=A0A5J4FW78_9FLAO|nr:type VI secretion system tube protein TssD [Patiriisocius marinistellae]GEQ86360.1 hypothetical protein ULMS_18680 [Patiriisocius marinistellae]